MLIECRRFNYCLQLFQVDNLYVEVYSMQKAGEIVSVNAFEDTGNLETYLEEIDISELVSVNR